MSSIAKNTLYSIAILMLFPMSAFAEVKIIIGAPAYLNNYPKYYSNKHHSNNTYKHNNNYNKYDFPPYSYQNKSKYFSPGYRYQPRQYYKQRFYNPYAYNINQNQYRNGYQQGFRDGYSQKKRSFKLGN